MLSGNAESSSPKTRIQRDGFAIIKGVLQPLEVERWLNELDQSRQW
jgi:hypothetical protein